MAFVWLPRFAAWVIGTRNLLKATLVDFPEPGATMRKVEIEGDHTTRLALGQGLKSLPWAAV